VGVALSVVSVPESLEEQALRTSAADTTRDPTKSDLRMAVLSKGSRHR
jgi:hypothetical protein